ncbi:MAG: DUF2752 domain-containing protein [Bacteroidales bacterium]|nr:DUF2752 domain-containing protein [Bacteroidales bacterium]
MKKSFTLKIIIIIFLIIILSVFIYLFSFYDPEKYNFFPKCLFYSITGYKCPGCGIQRAIHHIFIGDFVEAFKYNSLAFFAIPYVLLLISFKNIPYLYNKFPKFTNNLSNNKACLIIFIIIVLFWIFRNIFNF